MGFDLKRGNKLCEKIKVKIHQGGLHVMIEKSWSENSCEDVYTKTFFPADYRSVPALFLRHLDSVVFKVRKML
jgi:hypothetical protein